MQQAIDDLKALRDEFERLSHAVETHRDDTFGRWAEIVGDAISALEVAQVRQPSATADGPKDVPMRPYRLQWEECRAGYGALYYRAPAFRDPHETAVHYWRVAPAIRSGRGGWIVDADPCLAFAFDSKALHATADSAKAVCQDRNNMLVSRRANTNGAIAR